VILDDADLEAAVVNGIKKCYLNSGQTCSALTRMLVPREVPAGRRADRRRRRSPRRRLGEPFDETTALGPLVSDVQRTRVREYIDQGQQEGAKLVAGGSARPRGSRRASTSSRRSSARSRRR
jgi:acyl-CoA reductase-like NAD-dependent aldehyde dehydrogenase